MGAGLSGCTLGYLLKQKGKSVLILEKADAKKKDKLCGGIVTQKSVHQMNEIFGEEEVSKLPFWGDGSAVSTNQNLHISVKKSGVQTLPRKALDDFVLQKYLDVGGELLDHTTFTDINTAYSTITAGGITYGYGKLVAADGTLSAVRKTLTGETQAKNLALELFTPEKSDELEIIFKPQLTGYFYKIPNAEGTIYGLGDVSGNVDHLRKMLVDFYGKEDCPEIRGAFLPNSEHLLFHYGDNIFFIGDAAGLILPITGEGIYLALLSARFLSQVDTVKQYETIMKNVRHSIIKHQIVFRFIYCTAFRNFMYKAYPYSRALRKLVDAGLSGIL